MKSTAALLILTMVACTPPAKTSSSLRAASASSRYTITSQIEVLKPINPAALTTDAQSGTVVSDNGATVTLKVTVDPRADQLSTLMPNPTWRVDDAADAALKPYLDPGVTTNWDPAMRTELVALLKADGIDPDALDDVALVKAVSHWLFGAGSRFPFLDHFVSYDVQFSGGKATVIPELMSSFEDERQKNQLPSDDAALALGIFGKTMFEQRHSGNCTMSATLQATVLKALGIPTRLIVFVPAVDANDPTQLKMAADGIHDHNLQKTVLTGLSQSPAGGWTTHTFNEVFIGKRWVRLNYDNLGQAPADPVYLGLMIQVQSMADWADGNMGLTWGIHAESHALAALSSNNPYAGKALSDDPSSLDAANNPTVPSAMTTAHLVRGANGDDPSLPVAVRSVLEAQCFFLALDGGSTPPDFGDTSVFRAEVSRAFWLKAAGHPDVRAHDIGSWQLPEALGFQVCADSGQTMAAGVAYSLVPDSAAGAYHWTVDSSIRLVVGSGVTSPTAVAAGPATGTDGRSTTGTKLTTVTVSGAAVASSEQMVCQPGSVCVILALVETIPSAEQAELNTFAERASQIFTLSAAGQPVLTANLYGITLDSAGRQALALILDPAASAAMIAGVAYSLAPVTPSQSGYSWVTAPGLTVAK